MWKSVLLTGMLGGGAVWSCFGHEDRVLVLDMGLRKTPWRSPVTLASVISKKGS